MLASPRFAATPRLSALFSYIVRAALDGDGERLKGYSIGVDVFERPADFDASADSIVRVQMGRLRRLLADYYADEGADDPVRIDIPKGTYQPDFSIRKPRAKPSIEEATAAGPVGGGRAWSKSPLIIGAALAVILLAGLFVWPGVFGEVGPNAERTAASDEKRSEISIAVLPFRVAEGDLELSLSSGNDAVAARVADGILDKLVSTLSQVSSVSLSSPSAVEAALNATSGDVTQIGDRLGVSYVLEGRLQRIRNQFRLSVQLSSTEGGRTVWAQVYDVENADVFSVQDDIVIAIVQELRPRLVSAAKTDIAGMPDTRQTAWELYLQATWAPGDRQNSEAWHRERIELAQRALELEPDFGPAHSVLSARMTLLGGLLPDMDTPEMRDAASEHASLALDLSRDDPNTMLNVGFHYWRTGDAERSARLFERVLELDETNPVAVFMSYLVLHDCSPASPDVIDRLVAYDGRLSPDNPVRSITLRGIAHAHFNNGNMEAARDYAKQARRARSTPETVMMLAAAAMELGDPDEARLAVTEMKASWPNVSVQHFANTSIVRRCEGEALADTVPALYQALADLVEPQP